MDSLVCITIVCRVDCLHGTHITPHTVAHGEASFIPLCFETKMLQRCWSYQSVGLHTQQACRRHTWCGRLGKRGRAWFVKPDHRNPYRRNPVRTVRTVYEWVGSSLMSRLGSDVSHGLKLAVLIPSECLSESVNLRLSRMLYSADSGVLSSLLVEGT